MGKVSSRIFCLIDDASGKVLLLTPAYSVGIASHHQIQDLLPLEDLFLDCTRRLESIDEACKNMISRNSWA